MKYFFRMCQKISILPLPPQPGTLNRRKASSFVKRPSPPRKLSKRHFIRRVESRHWLECQLRRMLREKTTLKDWLKCLRLRLQRNRQLHLLLRRLQKKLQPQQDRKSLLNVLNLQEKTWQHLRERSNG